MKRQNTIDEMCDRLCISAGWSGHFIWPYMPGRSIWARRFVQVLFNNVLFLYFWKIISYTLRKHTYAIYRKFHLQKTEKFQIKTSDIFHVSAQNIDCGYSLEPPRSAQNSLLVLVRTARVPTIYVLSRNKNNNVYPCKPQFYYKKVGFKGVKII